MAISPQQIQPTRGLCPVLRFNDPSPARNLSSIIQFVLPEASLTPGSGRLRASSYLREPRSRGRPLLHAVEGRRVASVVRQQFFLICGLAGCKYHVPGQCHAGGLPPRACKGTIWFATSTPPSSVAMRSIQMIRPPRGQSILPLLL